ncbi:MAG: uracil-DNA glycosylase [Pseudomonadota bacterium]
MTAIKTALSRETRPVLPEPSRIFAALRATPPERVRAVILGQDPYPTPGHADGLAFSVRTGTHLPRSLANIFTEMHADLGARPASGDLSFWAAQGVLLLNTVLTVPAHTPRGHAALGWQAFAASIVAQVSQRPCAFLLWGRDAQRFRPAIRPGDHLILQTAHPSPLSARRGFFGSRPFSQINTWLAARGDAPIDWIGPAGQPPEAAP